MRYSMETGDGMIAYILVLYPAYSMYKFMHKVYDENLSQDQKERLGM